MSSIAAHLAAFEFHKANNQHKNAADEGYLFLQVHWQELIAAQSPETMELGRADFERRLREQHPDIAEPLVERWRSSMVATAQPEQVAQDSQAARDVLAERQRQVKGELWTPEHDDEHDGEELAFAAAAYMTAEPDDPPPSVWPWDSNWWKPAGRRRNLVKACALALAEIERLERAARARGNGVEPS